MYTNTKNKNKILISSFERDHNLKDEYDTSGRVHQAIQSSVGNCWPNVQMENYQNYRCYAQLNLHYSQFFLYKHNYSKCCFVFVYYKNYSLLQLFISIIKLC